MSDSPKRQRLGDKWFHTLVLRRSQAPAASLRSDVRLVAVALIAFAFDVGLEFFYLFFKAAA